MVVTVLEAHVADENRATLEREYGELTSELPVSIVESLLLHAADSDLWRIFTVWRSRKDLEDYREAVETPGGVLVFRASGAEPTLTVFDVAAHASH